jgi:hypothetical protein
MTEPETADANLRDDDELTEELFAHLARCAQWQRLYGERANWTAHPLDGIPLELCERGYLIADDLGGVLFGLSVTDKGFRKVSH